MWIIIVEDDNGNPDYIVGPFPTRESSQDHADGLPYPDNERTRVYYMNPVDGLMEPA